MSHSYRVEETKELADFIKQAGYRVFLASRGTHGFYTDQEGTRVVSFQRGLGGFDFSGNYVTDQPLSTGSGWGMGSLAAPTKEGLGRILESNPPQWAVKNSTWSCTTLAQYLAKYQASSKFEEVV